MDIVLRDLKLKEVDAHAYGGDPNGRLLIFEEAESGPEYFMGVDVGSGIGLSNSIIHVLRKGDDKYPDIQVAEFATDFLNPHELAPIINLVGGMYWCDEFDLPAMACIEINNRGDGCQHDLMTYYGYPNIFMRKRYDRAKKGLMNALGWETTSRTRPLIVHQGAHFIQTGQWIINSPYFIEEMRDFEVDKLVERGVKDTETLAATGRAKAGAKDDRLMAGFIASWCANDIRGVSINPADERAKYQERKRVAAEALEKGEVKPDFQNTDMTFEEMMALY
jgi:hypothetical protein